MSYNLLKGKKGLIFGALNEQSIAWKVAERGRGGGRRNRPYEYCRIYSHGYNRPVG